MVKNMTINKENYGCPKCGHDEAEVGEISTTGSGLSRLVDVQTNKFKVVTCKNCGYSELYKETSSTAGDVLDFFLGG